MLLQSIFKKQITTEFNSKYNGKIKLIEISNLFNNKKKYKVMAGGLLQSGSIITQLWTKPLKNISISSSPNIKHILLLGLGGGTILSLLQNKFPNVSITAIEIDPIMIKIAKEYFETDKIPNLNIIQNDAFKYIQSLNKNNKFDLILIDLFAGETQPNKMYKPQFINKIIQLIDNNGIIFINCLFFKKHKKKTENFIYSLTQNIKNKNITLIRSLSNIFIKIN